MKTPIKTEAQKRAEAAMVKYKDAYEEWNGISAPKMQYERGWISISCVSDRMLFPYSRRIAELESDAETLLWKIKQKNKKEG